MIAGKWLSQNWQEHSTQLKWLACKESLVIQTKCKILKSLLNLWGAFYTLVFHIRVFMIPSSNSISNYIQSYSLQFMEITKNMQIQCLLTFFFHSVVRKISHYYIGNYLNINRINSALIESEKKWDEKYSQQNAYC